MMTPTYKICDSILKFYKVIYNHRKHIAYVSFISLVQVTLVLWYLNFKKPNNSLRNIEKGITELSQGQKDINDNIKSIRQQMVAMVKNDSIMDDQLRHYPATLPIAMADLTKASSVYSERIDPITGDKRFHWGIDYPAKKGTPVYATAKGVIEKANKEGDYGNVIKINHRNGYESLYAHLNEIDVSQNQEIDRGELIGTVGNTGRATGNHLHYEITYMERRINPNIFRTPLNPATNTSENITKLLDYRYLLASMRY